MTTLPYYVVSTYGSLEETRGFIGLGNETDMTTTSALRGTLAGPP